MLGAADPRGPEGAAGVGRAGGPPPLPTVPCLLRQPPHLIRCQPEVRDKGPFSAKTISPRKAARYPGPPSSAINGTLEVGLPCSSSLWSLKAQAHHRETKQTEKDKSPRCLHPFRTSLLPPIM